MDFNELVCDTIHVGLEDPLQRLGLVEFDLRVVAVNKAGPGPPSDAVTVVL